MKFLAIHTAAEAVEIALYLDGAVTYCREAQFKKASAVCMPSVQKLLSDAKVSLAEMDFVGVCTGPGSFTGIRIGLTTARAFAQFAATPLVTVTATEILAYNTECMRAVSMLDAANGFVYAAVYEGTERQQVTAPLVLQRTEVQAFLDAVPKPYVVCADTACHALVGDSYDCAQIKTDCSPLVAALLAAHAKRGTTDYKLVIPLYVRKSQAEERFGSG